MSPQTERARARYNRLAPSYDRREAWMERLMFDAGRRRLWARVKRPRVLEVGVGTGKNIPHYPPGMQINVEELSAFGIFRLIEATP